MPRAPRIVIIGGGIGGLAAALALEQRGAEVIVTEQLSQLSEIGAGLNLTPNAIKAFRALGLEDRINAIGAGSEFLGHPFLEERPLHFACAARRSSREIWRTQSYRTSRRLALDFGKCTQSHGYSPRQALRRGRGRKIPRWHASPMTARSKPISSSAPTAFIRQYAEACLARTCRVSPAASAGAAWRRPRPCRMTSTRPTEQCGWAPTATSCITLCAAANSSTSSRISIATPGRRKSWTRECDVAEPVTAYAGWHSALTRLFPCSTRWYKWALYDRDPLEKWSKGRVTLLGDSAHAMLPYLGQGAAMAIEDGCVLAATIVRQAGDLDAALLTYEQLRAPRTKAAVLGSRARARENHLTSRFAQFKRNVVFALRERFGSDSTAFQAAWLYEYDVGRQMQ